MSLLTPPPPPLISSENPGRPSLFHSDVDLSYPQASNLLYDSGDETTDISEDGDSEHEDISLANPLNIHSPTVPYKVSISAHSSGADHPKESFTEKTTDRTLSPSTKSVSSQQPTEDSKLKPPKNIFYIDNTPSPSAKSSNTSNGTNTTNDTSAPTPFDRQDSLFSNRAEHSLSSNHLSGLSSSEVSEDEEDECHALSASYERRALSDPRRRDSRSVRSQKSFKSDNESEWVSMSSEDENEDSSSSKPLTFSKRIPVPPKPNTSSSNLSLSDEKSNSSSLTKPRSLLSGLFLNSLAMRPVQEDAESKNENGPPMGFKPVLKRSSTTGVITMDKSSCNQRQKPNPQKASLLFSKRFASSSDMNDPENKHVSPVLFIQEENDPINVETKMKKENLFAKQTSCVGLSDFNVAGNSNTKESDDDGGLSEKNSESKLSSSLSRYSRSFPSKNFLFKSSLSLTSLLGTAKPLKSMPSWHSLKSSDATSLAPDESQENVSENLVTSTPSSTDVSKCNTSQSLHHKQVKLENVRTKAFEPPSEVSGSLKDSLYIDHKLGRAPLPDRVISDEDLLGGLKKAFDANEMDDYHSKGW